MSYVQSGMEKKCLFPCKQVRISLQFDQISLQYIANFPYAFLYFFSQNHKMSRQGACQIAHFFSYTPSIELLYLFVACSVVCFLLADERKGITHAKQHYWLAAGMGTKAKKWRLRKNWWKYIISHHLYYVVYIAISCVTFFELLKVWCQF